MHQAAYRGFFFFFFFFFCTQQFTRLVETIFVTVQHKRDFCQHNSLLCPLWNSLFDVHTHTHAHTHTRILELYYVSMLPCSVHWWSSHCKVYAQSDAKTCSREWEHFLNRETSSKIQGFLLFGQRRNISKSLGRWWRGWLRNLRDFSACTCRSSPHGEWNKTPFRTVNLNDLIIIWLDS